ncbi:MAG TPA: hypothetical protein VFA98_11930 [Thermoanaerobaculia bacterium]|jgi:hypothetical protein|nr:hypothetical protein [Thermoanaerobaculia bacterium]
MDAELSGALDDLVLGRGVARGRHELTFRGRPVRAEFEERLAANGFVSTTVAAVDIAAGERVPAFHLEGDAAEFGWVRWEIFTPRSRRKLFASERRRTDNQEWAVQLNLSSPKTIWAAPARRERHDVHTVVAVNP